FRSATSSSRAAAPSGRIEVRRCANWSPRSDADNLERETRPMSLQEEVQVLRNIPLFARIEPSKLKLLAFTSERVTFAAGDTVFRQGDMGDAAYIVIDGEAEVLVDTPHGPIRVATVGRNEIIGEIAILIDVPRTATIRAKTRLVTLRIAKD